MAVKVLTIDDDPDILIALTLILESQGYEVITARDGLEGLGRVKLDVPNLIILDLMMPRMDGFAVCKELQKPEWVKYQHIPKLILTSIREDASRRRYELETGVTLEADSYIEKPIHPDVLLENVAKLLKGK
ncbi:MAG TPA: response regulator [Dehalococcoidia bacterium]|nr:response regulator [Dehalococcoidia bacterium]